jgi:hypothetical protein
MPDDRPEPLDYRNPKDDRVAGPSLLGRIASILVGGMCGFLGTFFAGTWAFGLSGGEFETTRPSMSAFPTRPIPAIVVFFAIAVATIVFGVRSAKRPPYRWFLIGFLMTTGGMCLIEGLCFMNS